ncbi:PH domain-containing protein [Solilutibacter pythonis]|nr:PH domain-containing protein [Lysobacter pythonis]
MPTLVIGLTLLACAGALALAWREAQGAMAWLLPPLAALVPALTALALRRRQVVLDDGILTIVAGLNRRRVTASALRLEEARVIDIETNPEYRVGIKTFGTAIPGYYAGHFRQIGGRRIFALITDTRRVLAIPENDGRLLMLSLQRPQSLLDALRRG